MEGFNPVRFNVVPIAVQLPINVGEQAVPLNASIYILALFKLLPPPTLTSILTAVTPAGVVNEYHTSLVVPQRLVGVPALVAWYKVPDVLLQLVAGDKDVGAEQSLLAGCAIREVDPMIKNMHNEMIVRIIGNMVFQGF